MLPTSRRGLDNPCSSLLVATMIGRKVVVEKKGVPTRSRAREEKPRGEASPRKHTKLTHCNRKPRGKTRWEQEEEVKPSASSNPRPHHQDPYTKCLAPGSLAITQPIFWSRVHSVAATKSSLRAFSLVAATKSSLRELAVGCKPENFASFRFAIAFCFFARICHCGDDSSVHRMKMFSQFQWFLHLYKIIRSEGNESSRHKPQLAVTFLADQGVSSLWLHHHTKYTTIRFCIPSKHSGNIKPCTNPISPPISSLPISLHGHFRFKQHFFGILINGPSIWWSKKDHQLKLLQKWSQLWHMWVTNATL